MALTAPRRTGNLSLAPQTWTAKPGVTIWEGAMVGRYQTGAYAGFVDNIGADPSLTIVGIARHTMVGSAAAGATPGPSGVVDELVNKMVGAGLTTAHRGALAYGVDENTVSILPGSGPPVGMIWEVASATAPMVAVGPSFVAQALAQIPGTPSARAVITTLAAFAASGGVLTASATGAIGAQDTGVTLAAGDLVILPLVIAGAGAGTVTAAMTGPYIVTNPGASSPAAAWVLTRPPWWAHGGVIPEAAEFRIGEGTKWAGHDWRALPASAGLIIGTGDPAFWPRTDAANLVSGTGSTTMWIRDVNRVSALNVTGNHSFYASTLTAGPGSGAVTITGTATEHFSVLAVNF